MNDLERELEQELHRVLDPIAAMPLPARRQDQARGLSRALFGGAGTALGLKLLTGVAVAAAAVTVAGVSTTGSLNPVNWGQQVKQHVATCKDELAAGDHGIGACVSSFANQHGQTVGSEARQHGNSQTKGAGKDNSGGQNAGSANHNGTGNNSGNGGGHGKDEKPPKGHDSPPPG